MAHGGQRFAQKTVGCPSIAAIPSGTTSCSPTPDFLTGKPRDTESNLDDFGARYFGSRYGQWMSPDWSSSPTDVPYASMGNPQSMNLYAYVGNDPIDGQDADGHVSYLSGDGSWDGLDGFAKHEMAKASAKPASNGGISPAQKCVGWLCWLRNVFAVNGGSSVSPSGRFGALMMAGGATEYIEASTYMRQHPAAARSASAAANLALLFGTDGLSGELEAGAAASEMTAAGAQEFGMLRKAAQTKGMFGMGVADADTANSLGEAWAGGTGAAPSRHYRSFHLRTEPRFQDVSKRRAEPPGY